MELNSLLVLLCQVHHVMGLKIWHSSQPSERAQKNERQANTQDTCPYCPNPVATSSSLCFSWDLRQSVYPEVC